MRPAEIAQLLPAVFQRTLTSGEGAEGKPLDALLSAMSALHERSEEVLGELDRICDPHRTYDFFVPFLARWVDLERIFRHSRSGQEVEPISSGMGNLRQLVAAAAQLSRWRGTPRGLVHFLEIATGIAGFVIEENPPDDQGRPRSFHFLVRVPAAAAGHRALIEHILDVERPAYSTWGLAMNS
jgi:phage tail-like protein